MSVKVVAPAHLHAGNFDLTGDMGRLYGTVGFALDVPIEVRVREGEARANEKWAERFVRFFAEKLGVSVEAEVRSEVPPLAGMGYVTGVALAIGMGISKLFDFGWSVEDVALIVKRGLITSLGVHAFRCGGFIVEGGFRVDRREKMVPPLIFRGEVPEDWKFVVAVPEDEARRIAEMRERAEDEILSSLKTMPAEMSDRLSRIVLVKIIPAFVEGDLNTFAEGLTMFNSLLGEFWSEYQGSKYCCPVVEKGVELMIARTGCGCQSSWGPAFYTITTPEVARELAKELEEIAGRVFVASANNEGARYG
ncbi:MAG: beta-ribofuranosylaminobenzene 5'-phosphate synthase family protein [Archaeoglobaceae archaeon]